MSERETGGEGRTSRVPRLVGFVLVVPFLVLLAYGLATTGSSTQIDQSLSESRPVAAPGFRLEVLEEGRLPPPLTRLLEPLADGRLALAELRRTPVVLNFWASWCIPCREEAPVLEAGWRKHGRVGVLFLGLDMQDIREDARDFLHEFGITYPTIRDPGNEVARRYGATGIPETYFIDRRGRVVGHVIGVVSTVQLDEGVAAAKSGRVAGAREGGDRRPQR